LLSKLVYCRIKARSNQKSRLLTTLSMSKITVWSVETESNYITFSVKIKDLAKTFAILKNMCYNYIICSRRDVKSLLIAFVKRLGLIAGAFCSIACILFCNNTVLGLSVKTNNEELKEKVSHLASVQNSLFKLKDNIDLETMRFEIVNLDGVADCSVKFVGNRLEVEILDAPKIEDRELIYSAYVAKYDATVTSVVAKQGTPLVKSGDRVFAGAPLISPEVFNENGELITTTGVCGKVIGKVVFRKTLTVDKERVITIKTGRKKIYRSLSLHSKQISSPYKLYEKTMEEECFNLFLPIRYTITEYAELEERVVQTDIEEFAKNALQEFIIDCGQIGEETLYSYKDNGKGQYVVSLYIKTEMEIGIGV